MDNTKDKAVSSIEYLHKYSLLDHPQREMKNVKILMKDDFPCKCHKVQHALVPTSLENQYAKEYELCSTHCTRAQIVKSEDKLFFFQTCEAIPNKFALENVQAKPKPTLEVFK